MNDFAIIEFNDSGLTVAKDGRVLVREPGIALVEREGLKFGRAAFAESRMKPRETHSRYWHALNQEPMNVPRSEVGSHADLAFLQVRDLLERTDLLGDVVLAVHGGYSVDQLGLLLGLMQPQKVRAVGLVDAAVAGAAASVGPGSYRHLDLTQHGVVVTELAVGGQVERGAVDFISEVSGVKLSETAAAMFAAAFVAQSRFDPLHQGETEQLLYEHLDEWLDALTRGSGVTAELVYHGHRYQTRLTSQHAVTVLAEVFSGLQATLRGGPPTLVTARLARWPGLREAIGDFMMLPDLAVADACETHFGHIRAEPPGLPLIVALPARAETRAAAAPAAAPARATQSTATHVLIDDTVWALDEEPLYVTADGQTSRAPDARAVFVLAREDGAPRVIDAAPEASLNGRPLPDGATLAMSDVLALGELSVKLVRMGDEHGA